MLDIEASEMIGLTIIYVDFEQVVRFDVSPFVLNAVQCSSSSCGVLRMSWVNSLTCARLRPHARGLDGYL